MHAIHHIGQREWVHPSGLVKPDAHNEKNPDGREDEALEGSDEHGETGGPLLSRAWAEASPIQILGKA